MKNNNPIAVFKGHKVKNAFKSIVRIYDNETQPWTVVAFDEVFKTLVTVPKDELYDYVFAYLFNERKLWTTGDQLENLLSHASISYGSRHLLKQPDIVNTVCFLKREYANKLETGEMSHSDINILNEAVSKKINWNSPHCCVAVNDNITGKIDSLFITIPEFKSVIYANPEYFDVKEKTR